MKILVTGGTGFVGRNFLLKLIEADLYEEIYVVVRSREKLISQFQGDGHQDIPQKIRPILSSGPHWRGDSFPHVDHVVFFAGATSAGSRDEYFSTNSESVINFLKKIPAPEKIIVLSSHAAAGPTPDGIPHRIESTPDSPVTWYGESKLEMEKRLLSELGHLNFIILRPPLILGPRDIASLPLFKLAMSPIRVKPGKTQKHYSYIGVDDLIVAILLTLQSTDDWRQWQQRVFFLASDAPVTDRDLIETAAKSLNREGVTIPIPKKLVEYVAAVVDRVPQWRRKIPNLTQDRVRELLNDRWVVSSEAFKTRFAWKPASTIEQVVLQTKDWYQRTKQLK